MSDLLKVRIGGSNYLCKWEPSNEVEIGGRKYKTVKIGSQIWMAENLDWKWNELTIGGERINSPRALYYNNDESSYGYNGMKFGLLYNNPAKDYIRDNLLTTSDGWRLPTESDTNALNAFIDDALNIGYKLSEEVSWSDSSWTGNNQYGFNGIPVGQWNSDRQSFRYHGFEMIFWHSESDYVYERDATEQTGLNLFLSVPSLVGFYSIRLVKDAT